VLNLEQQLARGALVCPECRRELVKCGHSLVTGDDENTYPIERGVPILLLSKQRDESCTARDERAADAAQPRRLTELQTKLDRFFNAFGDQRSTASRDAWCRLLSQVDEDDLCLSVGGGPRRVHPYFVNLNIEAAENVEVVGDAHRLPYADGSVDAVHCEAVLEHLEDPGQAVGEMFRALRSGGEVYCVTPFLQGFHGYPSHYFNPTLEGHRLVFSRSGFEVLEAGVCVGPSWMISSLIAEYVSMVIPVRGFRAAAVIASRVLLIPVPFLDRWINRSPRAHILASTTFVYARKPAE